MTIKEELEEVPSVVKRCPRCNKLTLKFEKGRIYCTSCGFEQNIKR